MNGEPESGVSIYITIWATLISGAILIKCGLDSLGTLGRLSHRLGVTRLVDVILGKVPHWANYFAIVPSILVVILAITVGDRIPLYANFDPILQTQVSLATALVAGRVAGAILANADDRIQPVKPINLVPIGACAVLVVLVAFLLFKCPQSLAEKWWFPCFSA